TKALEAFYNRIEMQKITEMDKDIAYSNNEKVYWKYYIITQTMIEINRQPFFRKDRYYFDFKKEKLPDNTYFLSNSRYRKKQEEFEKEFREKNGSNLRTFVSSIIQKH
ncbi:MAG: hypothetical protein ABI855_09740, partial [Bacteroidota bacterium]